MNEGQFFAAGFEDDDALRSAFIRQLLLRQAGSADPRHAVGFSYTPKVPRTLVRYWHDPTNLPEDVDACLRSWDRMKDCGFNVYTFDDQSAAEYIARRYTDRESAAFRRCRHPAMRSDFLRMCFILADGGVYVDADDVLVGCGIERLLMDGSLKLQPLCYDLGTSAMAPSEEIWMLDLPAGERIFYVNNNPLAAPPGHPILKRALSRATARLLGSDLYPEIQSTTGPGNLSAALAAHARELQLSARPFDFLFIKDWETIAETRWDLSYRNDARNWRNMTRAALDGTD